MPVEAQCRRSCCACVHLRALSFLAVSHLSLAQVSHACTDRLISTSHRLEDSSQKSQRTIHPRRHIVEQIVDATVPQIQEQIVIDQNRKQIAQMLSARGILFFLSRGKVVSVPVGWVLVCVSCTWWTVDAVVYTVAVIGWKSVSGFLWRRPNMIFVTGNAKLLEVRV